MFTVFDSVDVTCVATPKGSFRSQTHGDRCSVYNGIGMFGKRWEVCCSGVGPRSGGEKGKETC